MRSTDHDSTVTVNSRWLTEKEAAERMHMSQKWLQKMRLTGGGPRFAKFGAAVRYSLSDIEAFELSCLRQSTSDASPGGALWDI